MTGDDLDLRLRCWRDDALRGLWRAAPLGVVADRIAIVASAIGVVKTAVDIYILVADRKKLRDEEKQKDRIAELETEVARLKAAVAGPTRSER